MAGDQGIANAYSKFFNAQAQEDVAGDPFTNIATIAAQAAQEWTFEKKKDEERAKKKGEAYQENMDEMFTVAADGYNTQGKELMHSTMASFADQMNIAVESGDKKKMAAVMMDARTVASEFQRGQKLLKEHSAALADGSYSKGAGTATLNKLLAGGDQDYQIYMETNPEKPNYLKPFFQIKGNNADVKLLSFDDLDKGNVKRADKFGGGYDKLIKEMVKESTSTGVHEFDAGQVERLLDAQLANNDVMYSAYHDNIFGDGKSIKEDRAAANKANGKMVNESWEFMWNDDMPPNPDVVMGNSFQNSGYNADAMRGIVKQELMAKARKEYDMRLSAYQAKVQAANNSKSEADGKKKSIKYGSDGWRSPDQHANLIKDIRNRKQFRLGKSAARFENGKWIITKGGQQGEVYDDMRDLLMNLTEVEDMPDLQLDSDWRSLYDIDLTIDETYS